MKAARPFRTQIPVLLTELKINRHTYKRPSSGESIFIILVIVYYWSTSKPGDRGTLRRYVSIFELIS